MQFTDHSEALWDEVRGREGSTRKENGIIEMRKEARSKQMIFVLLQFFLFTSIKIIIFIFLH